MLWLYGVAWHEPMADSIAMAKTATFWAPPPSLCPISGRCRQDRPIDRTLTAPANVAAPQIRNPAINDADTAALFEERWARPRCPRRATHAECWKLAASGELARRGPTRILALDRARWATMQAGLPPDAINAFRAAQYDPPATAARRGDRQESEGIVVDFRIDTADDHVVAASHAAA
jgi:hypothetical protein